MTTQKIEKAATLLLVRDGTSELEVFMLERPSRGAFPGLHVFTGGKVDAADAGLVERVSCRGVDDTTASSMLDLAEAPRAYWLAAIRECYEESGVLLGSRTGNISDPIDEATLAELETSRHEEFGALCNRLDLTLALDHLRYFAHWITPEFAPRRFDTRFFVAAMPPAQAAVNAPGETVSGEWISPSQALARADDGQWNLIMPTLTSLRSLVPYATVADLLHAVERFEHLPEYTDNFRAEGMQSGVNPAQR